MTRSLREKLLRAALRYIDLGWPVIPVCEDEGRRRPVLDMGCYHATLDDRRLKAWFGRSEPTGIAVALGVASGLFGIDADVKDGKDGIDQINELWEEHRADLRKVVRARTPSGGAHLYFRYDRRLKDARNLSCLLARDGERRPGLEFKCRGMLLILPPSNFGRGRYCWEPGQSPFEIEVGKAPAFLLDLIAEPPAKRIANSYVERRRSSLRRRARRLPPLPQAVRMATSHIPTLPIGEQNNQTNAIVFEFAVLYGERALDYREELVAAVLRMECDPTRPWTERQAEQLIDCALESGLRVHKGQQR